MREQAPVPYCVPGANLEAETRRTVAITTSAQAKALWAQCSAEYTADPYGSPLARDLKIKRDKNVMLMDLYKSFIFRQLPDGSRLPPTPAVEYNTTESTIDAETMWSAAGSSSPHLEYPIKLRCEDPGLGSLLRTRQRCPDCAQIQSETLCRMGCETSRCHSCCAKILSAYSLVPQAWYSHPLRLGAMQLATWSSMVC